MSVEKKLQALRQAMAEHHISVYLVGSADPHQSEYVAERYRARAWLSGFKGSAGTLAVSQDAAGLWVDSRYWLEAEAVMKGSPVMVFRQGMPDSPTIPEWIARHQPAGSVVSYDAGCQSLQAHRELEEALARRRIAVQPGPDLIEAIWKDRPARPAAPIEAYEPEWVAGGTREHLDRLAAWMRDQGMDWFLVSALDELAWLLNLRGGDVEYNPVFQAWLLAGRTGHTLFIDAGRLPDSALERLNACKVAVEPYEAVLQALAALPTGTQILLPPGTSSMAAVGACKHLLASHQASPVAAWKAKKTPQERKALEACLVRDGQAMVRAYCWLEKELAAGRGVTEYEFGEEIGNIRARDGRCRGESFNPIVGWASNGAIVHYSAPAKGSKAITGRGLLLVDTGGQYEDGTTDMTRTLLLGGAATVEEKTAYTLVLKGHVRLSLSRFPVGTNGTQLDTLARQPLWERGLNYGHGTGHGVGFYLNVHEGPMRIAPTAAAAAVALEPGNLLSNEPGFYAAGHFGVRIENLVIVEEDVACPGFLRFATLTVCPYEPALIDVTLLDPAEKAWINAYHKKVRELLSPGLAPEERTWLDKRTQAL